ncbi:xanthine dehydrogenase family protein molybdopterin-binding subunit [Sphingomonas endolithica]|uniref:xanthine dehydrogenase family protein molybdopterin-binding subunit n=1 Tax=Sphingomonas endolithica TaxID=2972485 RepID=UPI0021AF9612|nr:xanthine dehydrogenase family protein molybdopterin-binding subunit [Sphingomonas sp. ZFBP2030]
MSRVQNILVGSVRGALSWVPAQWLPGGTPDPLIGRRGEIGRQAPRVDGEIKVQGLARFSAEVAMDDLCYTALVHATITRGRIRHLDTAAAEAAPGVLLVVTHRNMPRIASPALISMSDLTAIGNSNLPILQDDQVHYNGQIVAAVVAETQEQADHAASLIAIDYDAAPAETRFEDAKADARVIPSLLIERNHVSLGRAERELARGPHKVDNLYRTPWQNHNAIELHALTVAWADDDLTVHDTTQMIAAEAATLAKLFGLKREQVRILSPFVGGGFGGKGFWDHQVVAVAIARMIGRPLRLQLTREGVYRIIGGRSPTEQRVAIGADADGRFTALLHDGWSVMPPYSASPEAYTLGTRAAYRSKSFEILQRHIDLAVVPNTFMRAPGEAVGTFALESAVDELAHALALDPIELRLRNLPDKHPISGAPFSQHAPDRSWRDGAARFGWEHRSQTPGGRRDGEWRIGMGCGSGSFPYMRMPGAAVRLTVRRDGTASLACSGQEMGMGTATVVAQQVADRLGLPLAAVSIEIGDSALPAAPMAGGSGQTVSIAGAILAAAEKLPTELLRLAGNDSPLAGLRAGEIRLGQEGLASAAEPSRHETFASILSRANRDEVSVTASGTAPLEVLKFAMHSTAAIFCELRVSDVTGEVRVDRLLGSFDCGTILNPRTAASQFRGGMIMGLGLALTEETLFDERTGRIMNPTLADYHVPSHMDVPEIDVIWTGIPDPRSPLGARGIGEIGITGVGAAVANAVFNATGKRVRDLPITLDKLL